MIDRPPIRRFSKRPYKRALVFQPKSLSPTGRLRLARMIQSSRANGNAVRTVQWANGEVGIYSRPKPIYNKKWDVDWSGKLPAVSTLGDEVEWGATPALKTKRLKQQLLSSGGFGEKYIKRQATPLKEFPIEFRMQTKRQLHPLEPKGERFVNSKSRIMIEGSPANVFGTFDSKMGKLNVKVVLDRSNYEEREGRKMPERVIGETEIMRTYTNDGEYFPEDTYIHPDWRSKGLGTYMYDLASSMLAQNSDLLIRPGGTNDGGQSPAAEQLWDGMVKRVSGGNENSDNWWARSGMAWNDGEATYNRLVNFNELVEDDEETFAGLKGKTDASIQRGRELKEQIRTDLNEFSEDLDADIEYITRGEQRWVFGAANSRKGELGSDLLKVNRYYIGDSLQWPNPNVAKNFWEGGVTAAFKRDFPFMLKHIIPAKSAYYEGSTTKMRPHAVIQQKVIPVSSLVSSDYPVIRSSTFKSARHRMSQFENDWVQFVNDTDNSIQQALNKKVISEAQALQLKSWVEEIDNGPGNFAKQNGKLKVLDYYDASGNNESIHNFDSYGAVADSKGLFRNEG